MAQDKSDALSKYNEAYQDVTAKITSQDQQDTPMFTYTPIPDGAGAKMLDLALSTAEGEAKGIIVGEPVLSSDSYLNLRYYDIHEGVPIAVLDQSRPRRCRTGRYARLALEENSAKDHPNDV